MKIRDVSIVLALFALNAPAATPGWLGLGVTLPKTEGKRFIFVQHVLPGGPADEVGIREQDLITAIDGKPIAFADHQAMVAFFRTVRPSQKVRLSVVRGRRKLTAVVQATVAPPRYAPLLRKQGGS